MGSYNQKRKYHCPRCKNKARVQENKLNRFLSKINFSPDENGCHNWLGSKLPSGYGTMSYKGTRHYSHRIAWEVFRMPIPDGLLVLHHCDNPSCCNLVHLFLGTHSDNSKDMYKKGRGYWGSERHKISQRAIMKEWYSDPKNKAKLVRKGRAYFGSKAYMIWRNEPKNIERLKQSKLSIANVIEIRSITDKELSNTQIGKRYGVGKEAIRKVRNGISWKNV